MNVSLCMIVRNEEANLQACLDTAADLVNEIIVVDTGSTDGTMDIARRNRARVFAFPWCDNFAAARNESIRRATGDWIFWLDADDRIEDASGSKLKALFASLSDTRDAYLIRCVCMGNGGVATHDVEHVRLFRNDPLIRYQYRVHEQVAPAVRRAGGSLLGTDVVIRHDGYRDPETYRKKQERNLRLLELECQERPLDPFMLYYRGVALLDLGRSAEALVSLQLCESLVPKGTVIARWLPVHLAEAYSREGMTCEAASTLFAAHAVDPADPDVAFAAARQFYLRGEVVAAEATLSRFLAITDGAVRAETLAADPSIAMFRARHFRAALRYRLGRYEECDRDARRVVETCPEFGEGWLLLGDAFLGLRNERDFERLLERLEGMPGTEVARILLLASQCARRGDNEGALGLVEEGMRVHGPHPHLERAYARLPMGDAPHWIFAAYFLSAKDLPGTRGIQNGTLSV